ncbi:MAG TPA: hypothetical protein QGF58_30535 [Myxococcota bacterium]|nr:hypothetical protein [Myxococcota bacterium]
MWMTLIALCLAEDAWTTEEAELLRWPGAAEDNPIVATVASEVKVEVLFREDERVRIRSGQDFGWVDATALSDEGPTDAGGLLEGLEIQPPTVPF